MGVFPRTKFQDSHSKVKVSKSKIQVPISKFQATDPVSKIQVPSSLTLLVKTKDEDWRPLNLFPRCISYFEHKILTNIK